MTVLTSYDDADLLEAGYRFGVVEMVRRRAEQAQALGVQGVVASAEEAKAFVGGRAEDDSGHPGIRPAGGEAGDQKRVATPASAIRSGADYLVVGRPITTAADPRKAAAAIIAEIAAARLIGRRTALFSLAPQIQEKSHAKGYVISRVDIIDPEVYSHYAAAATKAIAAHGGSALARGGRHEALEGKARARNVVLEFDS